MEASLLVRFSYWRAFRRTHGAACAAVVAAYPRKGEEGESPEVLREKGVQEAASYPAGGSVLCDLEYCFYLHDDCGHVNLLH